MKKIVDISMPLGPVHPCFREPVRIMCETKGEYVLSCETELGYMKRGIERIMRGRPWQEVMFIAERVCGVCSVTHNMVFIESIEKISGIEASPRALYLRVIANELARIQSHLLANFSYCHTIGHETLAMYLLNERESVMDELERLTGARVTCSYIIPGGVRFDISDEERRSIPVRLKKLEVSVNRCMNMFGTGPLIALRSKGIGILTEESARFSHAVGPLARGSGIPFDCRLKHPVYQKLDFVSLVSNGRDNYARVMLRFSEIIQSIDLIKTALETLPGGLVRFGGIPKGGETIHSGEAPRGQLTYYIRTDDSGRITDIAIETPSIVNIEVCTQKMIPGLESIADVASVFVSIDPCIACTER